MATGNKIIFVELAQEYNGDTRWWFGSLAAIYQHLPIDVVGVKLSTLQSKIDLKTKPYKTRTGAEISRGTVHRAKTNRGKRKELKE